MDIENRWRHGVSMFRKWEQRLLRSLATGTRQDGATRMLEEAKRELKNIGREMVLGHLNNREDIVNVSWHDDLLNDCRRVKFTTHPVYVLMIKNENPGLIYFRRGDGDPWIELGYLTKDNKEFRDTPTTTYPEDVLEENPFAQYRQKVIRGGLNYTTPPMPISPEAMDIYTGAPQHIHWAPPPVPDAWAKKVALASAYGGKDNIPPELLEANGITQKEEPNIMMEDPDDLLAAAASMSARAEEIKRFLNREPKETETTISWEWLPEHDQPGGPGTNINTEPYVFVAFRDRHGTWRVTSDYPHAVRSESWKALGGRVYAAPLRAKEPKFLLVDKWRDAK